MKKWKITFAKRTHDMPTIKSTLFAVSKDEWHTKKDTGKVMKNALYVLWYCIAPPDFELSPWPLPLSSYTGLKASGS